MSDAQLVLTEETLPGYLTGRGLLESPDDARVEAAGDGNINWVRRVTRTDGSSVIVKQARPALEKFPEYESSTDRIIFEVRYFARARREDAHGVCPEVIDFDEAERVLVLEDLGRAERLDAALARGADVDDALARVAGFLGHIHAATLGEPLAGSFLNGQMQRLHGDHIFRLPYQENDFPLPAPVRAAADRIRSETDVARVAQLTYERYLRPEGALVHADVQAGNILLPESGPKLLDAEIAHIGDPAFDVGSLVAHVALAAVGRDAFGGVGAAVESIWSAYLDGAAADADLDTDFVDVARYAGLEVMRRTIGAARVAAVESEEASLRAIELARGWILDPPAHAEKTGA